MTLLEIMVVMLIAGMMMSSAVMGFGAVRRGRLRPVATTVTRTSSPSESS